MAARHGEDLRVKNRSFNPEVFMFHADISFVPIGTAAAAPSWTSGGAPTAEEGARAVLPASAVLARTSQHLAGSKAPTPRLSRSPFTGQEGPSRPQAGRGLQRR